MSLSAEDRQFFAQMMQGGQQQAAPDLVGLIQALRAPKGRHLGIGGAEMTADNPMGNAGGNPFTNGFFKSNVPGAPIGGGMQGPGEYHMPNVLGGTAMPSPDQLAMTHMTPPGMAQPFAAPPILPTAGHPLQGMINPQLPDEQKYQDSNFWTAMTGSSLPQGVVAGDGQRNYRRKPAGFSFGTRPSSFSF